MGTERLAALTALDDSAADWRLERDKVLQWVLDDSSVPPALYLRVDPALVKTAAGDISQILFREGAEKGTSTKYRIRHNAAGELEFFEEASAMGMKIGSGGAVTFNGEVTGALPVDFPTILTGTLVHDPGTIPDGGDLFVNVTVDGADVGDPCVVAASVYAGSMGVQLHAMVTGTDTATVWYENGAGGSVNYPSHTLRVTVFHY